MRCSVRNTTRATSFEDGWRIWPGDVALTLNWLPTTDLLISEIGDEFCSHALTGSRLRVIEGPLTARGGP
jgi:hypothetical protein